MPTLLHGQKKARLRKPGGPIRTFFPKCCRPQQLLADEVNDQRNVFN